MMAVETKDVTKDDLSRIADYLSVHYSYAASKVQLLRDFQTRLSEYVVQECAFGSIFDSSPE